MACETLTLGSFGGPAQGSQEATDQGQELSQWHLERQHSEKAIGVSWPACFRTGDRELGYHLPSAVSRPGSLRLAGVYSPPSLPCAAPALLWEAFPLSLEGGLQWKNGHCSFWEIEASIRSVLLTSCSWFLSPT